MPETGKRTMKTYLELPHMLPIMVRSTEAGDQVWIEQPSEDDDTGPDAVLIHREQVKDVIDALKEYLRDSAGPPIEDTIRRMAAAIKE